MPAYIVGGKVFFERRVTTGQYEHKSASVEFNVVGEEGDDAFSVVDKAANLAHQQVHRLLNIPEPVLRDTPNRISDYYTEERIKAVLETAVEAVEHDKPRRGRPPKPPAPAAVVDAAAIGHPEPGSLEAEDLSQKVADAGAMDLAGFEIETAGVVPEVTDVDLAQAASRKQSEIGDAQVIKKLIGRYVEQDGKPHFLREIPQANRTAFLMELKTLVKS